MAAKYRPLSTDFWEKDKYTEGLTAEERYFYLYLITNPYTTFSGIYILPLEIAAEKMKLSLNKTKKLIKKFADDGKIAYSTKSNEICICNWLKYNCSGSPQQKKGIISSLEAVRDKRLINFLNGIRNILNEVCDDFWDTVSDTLYANGMLNLIGIIVRKENSKKENSSNSTTTVVLDTEAVNNSIYSNSLHQFIGMVKSSSADEHLKKDLLREDVSKAYYEIYGFNTLFKAFQVCIEQRYTSLQDFDNTISRLENTI